METKKYLNKEELSIKATKTLKDIFANIDDITYYNSKKVLKAFQDANVCFEDFSSSNGYGTDERGRCKVEEVYSNIFSTEDSLVRSQIISGTHALSLTMFGILRPGKKLYAITGMPYDTLQAVIGVTGDKVGSLADYGIGFEKTDLVNSDFDYDEIAKKLQEDDTIELIEIQRSCGYENRDAISIEKMEKVIKFIKSIRKDVIVMVDNCYGEFTQKKEPTDVGADLIVGSLMKNPGGGIAQTGGYIAGKKELIRKVAIRLTSPGIGKSIGPSLDQNMNFLKGIYLAPSVVNSALKTMIFSSYMLENLGYSTFPRYDSYRSDIVQKIVFNDKDKLIKFCQGIQKNSPIDSNAVPIPAPMGGYEDEVIMASGTFTEGSTIELSCDGPIRPPYIGYMQGSLTYDYGKIAILNAIDFMEN